MVNPSHPVRRGGFTRDLDMCRELRIIAVEFTLRGAGAQQEVAMFPCDAVLIESQDAYGPVGARNFEAIFTLHTSHGDRQVRGQVYL